MDSWKGKIAVVTGASSGIGENIAKTLAEEGIVVVALARRLDKLKTLASTVKGTIHPRLCDLLIEEDINNAFDWIEKSFGGVDILVNNAGMVADASLINGDTKEWRNIINLNLLALSICTKLALNTMRRRGDNGHIFHMCSVLGHRVPSYRDKNVGMYSATKYGVRCLAEALRVELMNEGSKIKITNISPGYVRTEMTEGVIKVKGEEIFSLPSNEMLTSQDISDIVVHALKTKPGVQIHDVIIQPIGQNYH